ncbi:unknown protein [Microcystis aeruginosa NIES-843]|uniref:Uncharacterized protein n=1 Tax=Microcystis aeruginosa (strain NIES-843 / IAM M-2473) TaxID=449447 RepID=B0JYE2_MICAN|nr:unknown protein [Microcystis aeruginosa NIES-843]
MTRNQLGGLAKFCSLPQANFFVNIFLTLINKLPRSLIILYFIYHKRRFSVLAKFDGGCISFL